MQRVLIGQFGSVARMGLRELLDGQGIEVVAGPCERITKDRSHGPAYYLPSAGAAKETDVALREWIGIGWYWLRGRI